MRRSRRHRQVATAMCPWLVLQENIPPFPVMPALGRGTKQKARDTTVACAGPSRRLGGEAHIVC